MALNKIEAVYMYLSEPPHIHAAKAFTELHFACHALQVIFGTVDLETEALLQSN
jgi:hypothetical protein